MIGHGDQRNDGAAVKHGDGSIMGCFTASETSALHKVGGKRIRISEISSHYHEAETGTQFQHGSHKTHKTVSFYLICRMLYKNPIRGMTRHLHYTIQCIGRASAVYTLCRYVCKSISL